MLVDDCVKKTEMSGVSPSTVLKTDMKGKVIVSMSIMGNEGWSFRGYKVMPRYRVFIYTYFNIFIAFFCVFKLKNLIAKGLTRSIIFLNKP